MSTVSDEVENRLKEMEFAISCIRISPMCSGLILDIEYRGIIIYGIILSKGESYWIEPPENYCMTTFTSHPTLRFKDAGDWTTIKHGIFNFIDETNWVRVYLNENKI